MLKVAEQYKIGTLSKAEALAGEKKVKEHSDKKRQEFIEKMKTLPPLDKMLNIYDF